MSEVTSEAIISSPYQGAVDAVKRGWAVIPVYGLHPNRPGQCMCGRPECKHPGKHPAEGAWQKSHYISTADCYTIWVEGRPGLNAGMLTGRKSNMVLIDIDPRNGGREQLAELVAEFGPLPDTYATDTGSGGNHYYFEIPPGVTVHSGKLHNSKGEKLDGIDVLSDGRMAILPGSVSGSGTYRVKPGAHGKPVMMLPEWIFKLTPQKNPFTSGEVVMAADLPTRDELPIDHQGRANRYALKVIEMECEEYANAKWGDGNARLFTACCNILEILQSPWSGVEVDYARQRLEIARSTRYARAQKDGRPSSGQLPDEVDITWESATKRVRGKGRPLPDFTPDDSQWEGILFTAPPVTGSGVVASPFMQPSEAEAAAIESLEGVQITEADRLQFAQAEFQAKFDLAVREKKRDLDVLEAAKKLQRTERANSYPEPAFTLLTDLLSEPEEGAQYRINGLWPMGGRIILAAQFKAGKSTLIGNVIRCLTDGDEFLGKGAPFLMPGETSFPVVKLAPGERVALIDLELDRSTVRRWLGDQRITNTDQVCVVPLRGRLGEFNIQDDDRRAKWASLLRENNVKVLVVDPLAPLLNSLGLDEKDNKDVGPLLDDLDTLCEEAGISEMLIAHHMGHSGDRSRGASRLRDWPDVEWKLIKEGSGGEVGKEAAPDAPRFFSAFGRDVLVQESKLEFDRETRRLFISGGDRTQHAATKGLPFVIEVVRSEPGIITGDIIEAIMRRGISQGDARKAVRGAIRNGELHTHPGPKKSIHHFINDNCATPEKCASGARLNFAMGEPTTGEIEHGLATIEAVFTDLFPGTHDGVSEGKVRIHAMDETRKLSVSRAIFDRAWDEALDRGMVVQVGTAKVYRWDTLATSNRT